MIVGLAIAGGVAAAEQESVEGVMDLGRLGEILKAEVAGVRGQDAFWEMVISGVNVKVIADQTHNRMRDYCPCGRRGSAGTCDYPADDGSQLYQRP